MSSNLKRSLFITSSILGIVAASVDLIMELLSVVVLVDYGVMSSAIIIGLVIAVTLCVGLIVMGAKLLKLPEKVNGEYPKRLGLNVTYLVFLGIMLIFIIYAMTVSIGLNVLVFLCLLAAIPIHIVAMVKKDVVEEPKVEEVVVPEEEKPAE